MQFEYNVRNINITSNKPLIYPSGRMANAECDIVFSVGDVGKRTGFHRVSEYYSVDGNAGRVYFEVSPIFPIVFRMYIEGIWGNHILVECNRTYYHAIKGVVGQLCPPEVHLHDIIVAKLLRNGISQIHAAAFEIDGKCLLIVAPPSTGKSLTCAMAVMRGAKMMSDDGVLTDGDNIYPIIRVVGHTNSTLLKALHRDDMRARILQSINNLLPFWKYIVRLSHFPMQDLDVPTIENGKVDAVVMLAYGDKVVRELSKDEALGRILTVNRKDLHYFKNEILLTYACFSSDFHIQGLMGAEQSILRRLVNNHPVYLCEVAEPVEFLDAICEGVLGKI